MTQLADFLYEVGKLSKTPRSGLSFLGTGDQSVAEHTYRVLNIAFVLARLIEQEVDELHLMRMVLFHDFPEARTGDLNWVNRKYVQIDDSRLINELSVDLPFAEEIVGLIREYEARSSLEARIASDADQLEFIVTLKEQADIGNPQAVDWIPPVRARLKTDAARRLAEEVMSTPYDKWWFKDKNDRHWFGQESAGEAESGISTS